MTAEECALLVEADASYHDLIDRVKFASLVAVEFAKHHVEEALQYALDEVPYECSDQITYEDVKGILTCYPPEFIV